MKIPQRTPVASPCIFPPAEKHLTDWDSRRIPTDAKRRAEPAPIQWRASTQPARNCVSITVNGQAKPLPPGATIASLLAELKLAGRPVAVEVNRTLVPREKHAEQALAEGDVVEIVALVGGG